MYKIDSPISFDVNLEPYCEDCCMSDLTISTDFLYRIAGHDFYFSRLTCSKYSLCKQIYERLKNETEKGEDDEIQD